MSGQWKHKELLMLMLATALLELWMYFRFVGVGQKDVEVRTHAVCDKWMKKFQFPPYDLKTVQLDMHDM